jgi:hypothetical protein
MLKRELRVLADGLAEDEEDIVRLELDEEEE